MALHSRLRDGEGAVGRWRRGRSELTEACQEIHGADMPGLDILEEGFDRIDISYEPQADGASITYATNEPALVTALHEWFAAQTSDHGEHAE